MKKIVRACLAVMLGILVAMNVYADSGMAQYPDYVTDYYMVVESPNGGIDFYVEANFDSSKLNNELIPNGTAFRIEGEVTDASQHVWGYSKYHGMTGYICEDDCRMVTRSEAIKSELSIAETAEADYDYTAVSEKILYNGPGEKFGKVSGSVKIPEGTTVHITKEAKLADGSDWGYTFYQYEGWISLESLVNIEEENIVLDENGAAVLSEEMSEEKTVQITSTPTPKPTATSTPTPKPTATSTPTPEPTATSTPTPEPTATNTPTPEPTATNTPTPEPTATNTPTPEATATDTPTPKSSNEDAAKEESTASVEGDTAVTEKKVSPTNTEGMQEEASSINVTNAENWYQNPLIWLGGICILFIILVLIYHFIKKNK